MPSNEIHQSNFEVIPVPLDLCMHLQLLYFAAAVDVVGQRVAPCVRVRSDKVPPERSKSAKNPRQKQHLDGEKRGCILFADDGSYVDIKAAKDKLHVRLKCTCVDEVGGYEKSTTVTYRV